MNNSIFAKLTEITTTKKTLKTIVLSIIALALITVITCFVIFVSKLSNLSESIYVVNQTTGDVLKAERVDISMVRPIEARAHVRKFIDLFFNMNKLNIEDQLSQAYDLGGNTIHNLYKTLETKNWYKQIKQYNIVQYAKIQEIKMMSEEYPYLIKAIFFVNIESDITRQTIYNIELDFTVRNNSGERSDANPHNMFIDNINTVNWQQINKENN